MRTMFAQRNAAGIRFQQSRRAEGTDLLPDEDIKAIDFKEHMCTYFPAVQAITPPRDV